MTAQLKPLPASRYVENSTGSVEPGDGQQLAVWRPGDGVQTVVADAQNLSRLRRLLVRWPVEDLNLTALSRLTAAHNQTLTVW